MAASSESTLRRTALGSIPADVAGSLDSMSHRPERRDLEASPWSRVDRGVFALLAAETLGSLPLLVHPWYDASGDASLYLVTAQSLLDGEGYRYLDEPFVVRPPGFSCCPSPYSPRAASTSPR